MTNVSTPVFGARDPDARHHRRAPRATSISTSIAVCHSGKSDSFFGSFVM